MKRQEERYVVGVKGHPVRAELEEDYGVTSWQPCGVGGFSEVWRVVVDKAHIALKISRRPLDVEDVVLRELTCLRWPSIREHPFIVSYFGQWDVQNHLVTRWELGNTTLEKLLQAELRNSGHGLSRDLLVGDGRYPPGYMWQVASVVDFLSSVGSEPGMQHCDIKPENLVLFCREYVKLGDWGLAKLIDPVFGASHASMVGGTPGYAPPESLDGILHPTWDRYSLAATYIRLRTGQRPFGDDISEIEKRQNKCDFAIDDDLKDEEKDSLRRALDPDPERRPRSTARVFLESMCGTRPVVLPPRPAPEANLDDEMVYVEAGEFEMGSPHEEEERGQNEQLHRVRITRPFCVTVCPVTVRQFGEFARATGHQTEAECSGAGGYVWRQDQDGGKYVPTTRVNWRKPGFWQNPKHPVVLVSWNDCLAYCEWLSEREGEEYRLLTEAQWEYVCRGEARRYQIFGTGNGKSLSSAQANFDGRSPYGLHLAGSFLGQTCEVGEYGVTGWGVKNMHGNVWEWCHDFFADDYFTDSPVDDPEGPAKGDTRVYRGGGWESPGALCRAACRHHARPSDRFNTVGFRVMRVIN